MATMYINIIRVFFYSCDAEKSQRNLGKEKIRVWLIPNLENCSLGKNF